MTLDFIKDVVEVVNDKKAKDVIVLDVKNKSSLCDYQIICSVGNIKQAHGVMNSVIALCKEKYGVSPSLVEGKALGQWILIDIPGLFIHIFDETLRTHYAIENLWPDSEIFL